MTICRGWSAAWPVKRPSLLSIPRASSRTSQSAIRRRTNDWSTKPLKTCRRRKLERTMPSREILSRMHRITQLYREISWNRSNRRRRCRQWRRTTNLNRRESATKGITSCASNMRSCRLNAESYNSKTSLSSMRGRIMRRGRLKHMPKKSKSPRQGPTQ